MSALTSTIAQLRAGIPQAAAEMASDPDVPVWIRPDGSVVCLQPGEHLELGRADVHGPGGRFVARRHVRLAAADPGWTAEDLAGDGVVWIDRDGERVAVPPGSGTVLRVGDRLYVVDVPLGSMGRRAAR